MAHEVTWSRNAAEDFEKIFNYLKEEWSYNIAKEFSIECFVKIELISEAPSLGMASGREPTIRRILITKHNYLYYKLMKEKIILLDFVDTRQDPSKNPF
jgi:plasmid stabilization system protein ParE